MPAVRLDVVLPIEPVPASRARVSTRSRHAYHTGKYADYLKTVAPLVKQATAGMEKMTGPVAVVLEFVCPRPKRPTNPYPRGDFDNLAKAITDAITHAGTVWGDDVQIVMSFILKAYTEPGEAPHTKVRAWELDGGGYRRCWPGEDVSRALSTA